MLLHFPLHSLLLSSVRFAKLCRKFGLFSGRAKFYFGESQQKTLMARVPCPSITKGGLGLLSLCLVTHETLCSSITTHSLCALSLGSKVSMSLVVCLIDFQLQFRQLLFSDELTKITQLVSRQLQVFFHEFAISSSLFFRQLLDIQSDHAAEAQQDHDLQIEVLSYLTEDEYFFSD